MLRRFGLLAALTTLFATGCEIDRVEWEASGWPVDEVRHALEEEHHAESPVVECIQREVTGMDWECRAHAADDAFECHVKAGPRKVIHEIHCESEHEEGTAEHDGEAPAEHGGDPAAGDTEHESEDEPAGEEHADPDH